MLYGSLYKVFQQLSKQNNKDKIDKQYDEIIVPKKLVKFLLKEDIVEKKKFIKKNNKSTNMLTSSIGSQEDNDLDIDVDTNNINNIKKNEKLKLRGITPIIKNHYINYPNYNLPKIKFTKEMPLLTKKIEDLKYSNKNEFFISDCILNQMKKTFYQPITSHTPK